MGRFIVRLHHRESVQALAALFDGYGDKPAWQARPAAMTARAAVHCEFVRRWHRHQAEALWRDRITAIASWREI